MTIKNNFTVIICTYERPNLIKKCLEKILKNNFRPKKIIIVDQNPNKLTNNMSKFIFKKHKFTKFKIIKNLLNQGLTKSKNISLRYIKTKYVFFIDDDILLDIC